jgi:hypothetical protein
MAEQNWLRKAIDNVLSRKYDGEMTGTPDDMIDEAAKKAFRVSTALGLIPGPIGMATIIPEVAALAGIQIGLIRRIAGYHHKQEKVSTELVLLILGNVMGVAAGEALVRKMGAALVVRSVNTGVIRGISRAVGSRIVEKAAERAAGRWIPAMTAPVFGYMSRSLTRKIGREANKLFALEIIAEPPAQIAAVPQA